MRRGRSPRPTSDRTASRHSPSARPPSTRADAMSDGSDATVLPARRTRRPRDGPVLAPDTSTGGQTMDIAPAEGVVARARGSWIEALGARWMTVRRVYTFVLPLRFSGIALAIVAFALVLSGQGRD